MLLEGLAARALSSLADEAAGAAAEPDAAEGLRRLLRAGLMLQLRDATLGDVLASPEPVCVETLHVTADLTASISTVLGRATEAGVIATDLRPDDLRRLLTGVAAAARAGDAAEAHAERYLSILLAGLACDERQR